MCVAEMTYTETEDDVNKRKCNKLIMMCTTERTCTETEDVYNRKDL